MALCRPHVHHLVWTGRSLLGGCEYLRLMRVLCEISHARVSEHGTAYKLITTPTSPVPPPPPKMIDPITIATVAGGLVQVCGRLSGYIITYVSKSNTIDLNIEGLSQEIQSLSQVLVAMQKTFDSNAINVATLEEGTGHEAAHWKNVRRSLENCQTTLNLLAGVWEGVSRTDSRIPGLSRPKKVVTMMMSEEQITIYKGQISAFRQTIGLSLQLLTVYDPCWNCLAHG